MRFNSLLLPIRLAMLIVFLFPCSLKVAAAEKTKKEEKTVAAPKPMEKEGEEIEVDSIKEKYWAHGTENQIGVIQERLHTHRNKIEFSLLGGIEIGDPFLSTYVYGASLGFHFSEVLSLHAIGWGASATNSKALDAFERDVGSTANTNLPKYYLGGEGRASLLYGKLSLMNSAIIHFNTYFSLGAGAMATESGTNAAFTIGIGQGFLLSRCMALNIDYRLMRHNENVLQKQAGQPVAVGTPLGERANLASVITVGVSLFLDPTGSDKEKESRPPANP